MTAPAPSLASYLLPRVKWNPPGPHLLPSLSSSYSPRAGALTLALGRALPPASAAAARRRIAVARAPPEQICAVEKLRRYSLFLSAEGIGRSRPESPPLLRSSPPPSAADRARHHRRPTSPRLSVSGFVLLVSTRTPCASSLSSSPSLAPSRLGAARTRRRPSKCRRSGDPFGAAPPSLGSSSPRASDASSCAS